MQHYWYGVYMYTWKVTGIFSTKLRRPHKKAKCNGTYKIFHAKLAVNATHKYEKKSINIQENTNRAIRWVKRN